MKMIESTFMVKVTFLSPVSIERDTFVKVMDYSTAREAIDEGVWGSIDIADIEEELDRGEEGLVTMIEVLP